MKISIQDINSAKSQTELDNIVEQAASEANCELDTSMTYLEQADFFDEEAPKAGNGEQAMSDLSDILRAAESKWFELDS